MSSCVDPLKFKGVCHIGTVDFTSNIEMNLKLRLDWAIASIGGWIDVAKGQVGPDGTGDWSQLKPLDDSGLKWISIRKDWVYEPVVYTDLDEADHSPLTPIIYIDDVVQAGNYTINYAEGIVIFDSPVSLTASVQAAHSYRYIQTYVGDQVPWWQELQRNSFDLDAIQFTESTCGDWNIGTEHRVQMPTIIVDTVPYGGVSGYSLGEIKRKGNFSLLFHVFAEEKTTRNKIVDMLVLQSDTTICSFNSVDAAMERSLPINCGGDPTGQNYSELVTNYPWFRIRIQKARSGVMRTLKCGLYEGMVHAPIEVIFSDCGV